MKYMKSQSERATLAGGAIELLKKGIANESKSMILNAYSAIETDTFCWDNLEVMFMEWDELVNEANEILY